MQSRANFRQSSIKINRVAAIFEFIFTEFDLYARHSFDSYGLLSFRK